MCLKSRNSFQQKSVGSSIQKLHGDVMPHVIGDFGFGP